MCRIVQAVEITEPRKFAYNRTSGYIVTLRQELAASIRRDIG